MLELQSRGYPVELFDPKRVDRYEAVVYSKLYNDAGYDEAMALQKRGLRIAFDLCDNHFSNLKGLQYWEKASERLRRMMSLADKLVASTEAMAEVMRGELLRPRTITVIGDAVETKIRGPMVTFWERWWHRRQLGNLLRQLAAEKRQGRQPIVWFGNHGSPYADGGMLDLLKIRSHLEHANRHYPISLTVISNSKGKYNQSIRPFRLPTRYIAWHPDTFLPALRAHVIAVLPISVNPFTRCKSNNRLAQALHEGLAVVADCIPSYEVFAEVCSLSQWDKGLQSYLSNPNRLMEHVRSGQELVAKICSLHHIADQWQSFFNIL